MASYNTTKPSKEESEAIPIDIVGGTQVNLTEELGSENFNARMWYFSPGEGTSWHKQTDQEELYFVVSGPGHMKIGEDEEIIEIQEGELIRVPPEVPRQVRNETDDTDTQWLVVAAPGTEMDANLWDDEQGDFVNLEEWF